MRTRKVETMVEIDLSLDEFTDEEIIEEYLARELGSAETLAGVIGRILPR